MGHKPRHFPGLPAARLAYLLDKWDRNGWWDWGVNILYGWLTPAGEQRALEVFLGDDYHRLR